MTVKAKVATQFLLICPSVDAFFCQVVTGRPGHVLWWAMETSAIRLEWTPGRSTRVWTAGDPERHPVAILAHGAGAGADHPLMVGLRDQLVAAGAFCVTFNYPYKEEGRRWPDHKSRLLACHKAVMEWTKKQTGRTPVLAGRSMGGRMGTYLAAQGEPVRALVLYAYPLHPPGRPEKLRSEHLPSIEVPMLFFRGSRDTFSRPQLFDREVRSLPLATVVDLEGLDHSFRGRGRTAREVNRMVAEQTVRWLGRLPE